MVIGLARGLQLSFASQHKHLLCLSTTISLEIKQQKLACPAAPMAVQRINDPPSTLAVPYCPGPAAAGTRQSRGRRTRRRMGYDVVHRTSGIKIDIQSILGCLLHQ